MFEMGLSLLLMMLWTEEQNFSIEQEFQRWKSAGKNVTTGDL